MLMTDFADALKTALDMPVAHYQFNVGKAPSLPFAVYYRAGRSDEAADDINFYKVSDMIIELYSETKDPASEELVESFLDALEIPYAVDDGWIDSEKMFMTIYRFQILEGEYAHG